MWVQGIQGVRFKRLIMDESASDRSPHPPQEPDVKRAVFCSGKVLFAVAYFPSGKTWEAALAPVCLPKCRQDCYI